MPKLSSSVEGAVEDLAVQDHAAADTRSERHAGYTAKAFTRSDQILGPGSRARVLRDENGERHGLLNLFDNLNISPKKIGRVNHHAALCIRRAGHAQADAVDILRPQGCLEQNRIDALNDGTDDGRTAAAGISLYLLLEYDLAIFADHSKFYIRSADIHANIEHPATPQR